MAAAKESAPPPSRATSGGGDRPLSVTDAAALIDGALRDRVPTGLKIVGEVSGFVERTHWYFSLKDENAVLSCVMFAAAIRTSPARPRNGEQVVATGRIEFFARQGKTQLYVSALQMVGVGGLEQRYRALCEELRGLGWFAPERKRRLPGFPRRIAVVTSRTGAALQDVLNTCKRRCPFVEIAVIDTHVQGADAAPEVASRIDWVSAHAGRLGIDALIVTRGGGSMEDLWAFNEREVARAIVECSIPVVAAVGHETDTTIAELVADERAATPTQAAMRLTPDRSALGDELSQVWARAKSILGRHLRNERRRLEAAARRPLMVDGATYILGRARQGLASSAARLHASRERATGRCRVRLERLAARLARFEPRGLYAERRAQTGGAARRLHRAILDRLKLERGRADPALAWQAWSGSYSARITELAALGRELEVVGPPSRCRAPGRIRPTGCRRRPARPARAWGRRWPRYSRRRRRRSGLPAARRGAPLKPSSCLNPSSLWSMSASASPTPLAR